MMMFSAGMVTGGVVVWFWQKLRYDNMNRDLVKLIGETSEMARDLRRTAQESQGNE